MGANTTVQIRPFPKHLTPHQQEIEARRTVAEYLQREVRLTQAFSLTQAKILKRTILYQRALIVAVGTYLLVR